MGLDGVLAGGRGSWVLEGTVGAGVRCAAVGGGRWVGGANGQDGMQSAARWPTALRGERLRGFPVGGHVSGCDVVRRLRESRQVV